MDQPHDRSQLLADRLARHAGSIDLGASRVELVVRRGTQRRQRRRTATAILVVGSVCAVM
ncbi:MAG: hypothetical protein HZB15_15075, partial [Actinobacteria bacterium]|nr:hypothetical protein [Actinomycetota bacterium]